MPIVPSVRHLLVPVRGLAPADRNTHKDIWENCSNPLAHACWGL